MLVIVILHTLFVIYIIKWEEITLHMSISTLDITVIPFAIIKHTLKIQILLLLNRTPFQHTRSSSSHLHHQLYICLKA